MAAIRAMPFQSAAPELPPISALFLIEFDTKTGYSIAWKRSISGLELDNVVEYKSLPSGLHTVPEDLVYFVHEDGYAGLSAFVNTPTEDEAERRARMIAIGVLVPLSYGRLGRAWKHASALKGLARYAAMKKGDTQSLEKYWIDHSIENKSQEDAPGNGSPSSSPTLTRRSGRSTKGHTRNRSLSDGAALAPPGDRLSSEHPARSLRTMLETFGPLIFPIQRAALLRKRILISGLAPVRELCDFVYNISILANIPLAILDTLGSPEAAQRLRPLFTIGVHDIPFLTADDAARRKGKSSTLADSALLSEGAGSGWVACTTDSILATKETLWDLLITMPPRKRTSDGQRLWPKVEIAKDVPVKATHRDLRRFKRLRAGLQRSSKTAMIESYSDTPSEANSSVPVSNNPQNQSSSSTVHRPPYQPSPEEDPLLASAAENTIEPITWAALAYSGFMWWASAGEQAHAELLEESAQDAALLIDISTSSGIDSRPRPTSVSTKRRSGSLHGTPGVEAGMSVNGRENASDEEDTSEELAIITYFHRLTTQILAPIAEIVEATPDDEDDDGSDVHEVYQDDSDDQITSTNDGDQPHTTTPNEPLLHQYPSTNSTAIDDIEDGYLEDNDKTPPTRIHSDVVSLMGLDVWSLSDSVFVEELTWRYFGREAKVEGKGVDICGLKVC